MDIVKLLDLGDAGMYRLRVGGRRVLYAVITTDHRILVLHLQKRELGYRRLLATAEARLAELQGSKE